MKTIFKSLIFIVALSLWISTVYSQYEPEYVKIHTPLGHEPDKSFPVSTKTFDNDLQVEQNQQAWLFSGGIFKSSGNGNFTEQNNYIPKHSVLCMGIEGDNIYIGTKDGLYISTDNGMTWADPANDGIDNLPERKIFALSVNSRFIFACTDNGIYKSTDLGVSWAQSLNSKKVTCIEHGADDDIYAGVEISYPGVYKSTNNGDNWAITSLTGKVFCLEFNSPNLYAGAELGNGLRKSTDGGVNWLQSLWNYDDVTSILIDATNIYIGTKIKGCLLSTNGGGSFTQINTYFPEITPAVYYTLNSLQIYDTKLYAATENGLYNTTIPTISWYDCAIDGSNAPKEKLTKMICINGSDLWVACDENLNEFYFPSAAVIYDLPAPLNPLNFPKYNCHGLAWHLSEKGESGIGLSEPDVMNYIPENILIENWDYILETNWQSQLWDKVTYGNSYGHSGIKSPNNDQNETEENNIKIISKWMNTGPLVEHKLRENPWGTNYETVRYWKSKKEITGNITENQEIGRQIITDGSTTISDGNSVNFRIAPMIEHRIHLKPGFHAESGSTFHAFVDKSREIPWEEAGSGLIEKSLAIAVDSVSLQKTNYEMKSSSSAKQLAVFTGTCKIYNDPWKYSGKGSGTEEDPYQITDIKQFQEIGKDDNGYNYWILMNDIDASETIKWNPYQDKNGDTLYGGLENLVRDIQSLDGRGFIIRNLHNANGGLFWRSHCFNIKRLGFENIHLEGRYDVQPMTVRDSDFVMEECFITGKISRSDTFPTAGLINGFGEFRKNAIVRNCYTNLIISSDTSINNFAQVIQDAKVSNCYAAGSAIGPHVNSPFGYPGNVSSCFWDSETIKVTVDSVKGLGLSTADMMKRSTYESAGWDFEKVWYIDEGKDYPKLRAFRRDTTDIKEVLNAEYFSISPNPATDFIEISVEANGRSPLQKGIRLYDIFGQNCDLTPTLSTSGEGVKINVSGLAPGMYFVRIGDRVCKFIKI